jgi:hypothetical protein
MSGHDGELVSMAMRKWLWPTFRLRREALLVRVEVRDLRLWPVAAGRCS